MAIAQTPIASIRQPWDLLSPKERETAYTELSVSGFYTDILQDGTPVGARIHETISNFPGSCLFQSIVGFMPIV